MVNDGRGKADKEEEANVEDEKEMRQEEMVRGAGASR